MTWTSIFIAGLVTYLTRMGMIALIDKDVFNESFRIKTSHLNIMRQYSTRSANDFHVEIPLHHS